MHDDVIDHAETRRGKASMNLLWNARSAIQAGDYSTAIATKVVAQMENPQALVAMTQILSSLVLGELQQMTGSRSKADRYQSYLDKTYHKTASLMALSCKAVALLAAGSDEEHQVVDIAYNFGRNVGIAFQLVDDWLDFAADAQQLGKPAAADLKLGLATAPVLFATEEHPELESLIQRRFSEAGDVENAFQLVLKSNGMEETLLLAQSYAKAAINAIEPLKASDEKTALEDLAMKCVKREY